MRRQIAGHGRARGYYGQTIDQMGHMVVEKRGYQPDTAVSDRVENTSRSEEWRGRRRSGILVSILRSFAKAHISCSAVLTLLSSKNTWTLPPHSSFHPPTSSSSPRGTVGIPLLSLHQSCTLLGAGSPQHPPRESTFHSFLKKMDGIYTVCYSDDCESILLKSRFRFSARSHASFGYLPTIPYLPVVFRVLFFLLIAFVLCRGSASWAAFSISTHLISNSATLHGIK